jgi:hypothetical protein
MGLPPGDIPSPDVPGITTVTTTPTTNNTVPETKAMVFSMIDENHLGMQYLNFISDRLQHFVDTMGYADLQNYIDNTEFPLVSNAPKENDNDEEDKEEEESEEDIYGQRKILQRRLEIFLKNKKQTDWSPAAKALVDHLRGGNIVGAQIPTSPGEFWEPIIDLAIQTALQDLRIPKDYTFSSFLLISADGIMSGQRPHVDVMWPNYQFYLMVSDKTPGTTVYECKIEPGINNVDSFLEWLKPPKNSWIGNVLTTKFVDHCKKLTDYGTVLDTNNLQAVRFPVLKLSRGDLLSIPGSVVHGGPAFTGFRAILYFIGHAEGKNGILYNSDLQYLAGAILMDISYDLWKHITPNNRFCLLTRLFQMAQEYNDLYKHFGDPASRFYSWVKTYGSLKPKPNDTSVTRLIKSHADENRIDGSVSESIPGIIPKGPKPKGKVKAKVISKSKPIVKNKTNPNVITGKQTKKQRPQNK